MNDKQAKTLRRVVFGEGSRRPEREYLRDHDRSIRNAPGTPRAIYQQAKKYRRTGE